MARRRRGLRDGEEGLIDRHLTDIVRERGPLTVAAFMDLALYDARYGYYARAERRSGRGGDFFTSVDVGAIFGELLAVQLAEMDAILGRAQTGASSRAARFDLVEAGAGSGRLSADIIRAARLHYPDLYAHVRLYLVEASPAARAAQPATLDGLLDDRVSISADLPHSFEGALVANELLDAMPVHQVVMRHDGLREVYVEAAGEALVLREGPPSTPELGAYLERLGVSLAPGWRVEINLRARDWIRDAASRLRRGFMIVIDYGNDARELYSLSHAAGTLTSYARHIASDPASDRPRWLDEPGHRDITSHVDFTTIRAAAEAEGMTTLGWLDQTYFLLGLIAAGRREDTLGRTTLKERLALKTLLVPGGLGSTHKVLLLGRNVGVPALAGCSYRVRVT